MNRETELMQWREWCKKVMAKPPFTPGKGRILVCREPSERMTEGGIVLPDVHQAPSRRSVVIALGPEALNGMGGKIPYWLKPGDLVYSPAHIGTEINLGEKAPFTMMFLMEDDVIGRINS